MSEEITITPDAVVDAPEQDQLKQLREAAIKVIGESDGFILFSFKDGEVDLGNGQKANVPKSMFKDQGAIGGGSVSLAYVSEKAKVLLQQENDARNAQTARLSE